MSLSRKYMLILVAILGLLVLSACTREITTVLQENPEPSSCFECHGDQNTPENPQLVAIEQQWANSVHASGLTTIRSSSSGCSGCHSSEGFLDIVAGGDPSGYTNPTVIHCFTCHAPHTEGDFGLRVTEAQTLVNGVSEDIGGGNLCVACHQARREFATYFNGESITSSHWGPHHGTQADMLFGTNGYVFEGASYTETQWHRTETEDGCVDCHVRFVGSNFAVGGHTFNMSAAIDSEAGLDPEEIINTQACEACHLDFEDNTEEGFDYEELQTDVEGLLGDLQALLFAAGIVDDGGHPIGSRDEPNLVTEVEAGALWNFLLVEEDRSHGIHNPEYALSLLGASIAAVQPAK